MARRLGPFVAVGICIHGEKEMKAIAELFIHCLECRKPTLHRADEAGVVWKCIICGYIGARLRQTTVGMEEQL